MGGVTVAVLASVPAGEDGASVPVTVMVAVPPGARSSVVSTFPVPPAVVQAAQDHVTPVRLAGTASVTRAPTAGLGPALRATSV